MFLSDSEFYDYKFRNNPNKQTKPEVVKVIILTIRNIKMRRQINGK